MKKVLIIAGVAFLVSLAAGAGGRMMLAPSPSEEETAAALAAAEGHGDAEAGDETHDGAVDEHGMPMEGDHGPESTAPGDHAADHVGDGVDGLPGGEGAGLLGQGPRPLEFREMGHILASMEPREAGLFLSYLDDDRALSLLRSMSVGDVSEVLANMPDQRKGQLKAKLMAMLLEGE